MVITNAMAWWAAPVSHVAAWCWQAMGWAGSHGW